MFVNLINLAELVKNKRRHRSNLSEPYLVSICRNLPSARSLHERLLGIALHREVGEAERGGGGRLVQQRRVGCAPGQAEGEGRA